MIVALRDVPLLRCRSQRIGAARGSPVGSSAAAERPLDAVEVVRHLLAMQAQDLPAARWAVGLRAGAVEGEVAAALASGAVVRSWPMRGTLHLVPAEDLGWMLALTTPRLMAAAAARRRALGLELDEIERARELALGALEGGRELTREGILRLFEQGGVSTAGSRGYHLIWALAQTGTLVWGRQEGKEQVLVLLDEWVRAPRRLDRDEALGELAARYAAGHGPVTRADLARWGWLTASDAKRALEIAGRRVRAIAVDGAPCWIAPDLDLAIDAAARRAFASSVHALPGFDEYVIGYADRDAVLDAAYADRIVPGGNGVFQATIVAAGRVVGTWRRKARARKVVCEAIPFTGLSAAQATGFARAVAEYGRFLGLAAEVGAAGLAGSQAQTSGR